MQGALFCEGLQLFCVLGVHTRRQGSKTCLRVYDSARPMATETSLLWKYLLAGSE
jgi:hypothetical protein